MGQALNANGGVIAPTIPIVAVGATEYRRLAPELLGLDRIGGRRSCQHGCGCRHGREEVQRHERFHL
jgi:hypothetical protein